MMDRFLAEQPDPYAARREIEEACPMGRMGTVSEVTEPVLFLASDAASYITGVALLIDGLLTGGVGGVKLSKMYATDRGEG
jgi:NAD(P)-dependent dehydrogenase (short-subunit alcohol dehydrogenase family)